MGDDSILEIRNVTKEFPGVRALDNVSFAVRRGEVHAICGENGAGKSTLTKILCGVYKHGTYGGEVVLDGEIQRLRSVREAEQKGIVCIQQELALVPELSVAENIFLSNQPAKIGVVNWRKMYTNTKELINSIGISTEKEGGIGVRNRIKFLSIPKKQLVEILKALSKSARILILDEPTASLTEEEVDALFRIVNVLREKGITCVYISHKLNEIFRISDTVTVLRDGKTITTEATRNLTKKTLICDMVGRSLDNLFPREEHIPGDVAFEIRNYTVRNPDDPGRNLLSDVNLKARRNEILGISGLMGSGRTELFLSVMGLLPAKATGEVLLSVRVEKFRSARDALEKGLVLVTEDRKKYGLVLGMNVIENTTMSSLKAIARLGVLRKKEEMKKTNRAVDYFKIKTHSVLAKVQNLSGGNQQKVV
jgi:D-xylose transport system ATP-binding protein